MTRKSNLEKAIESIVEFFTVGGPKVYRPNDLMNMLHSHRDEWHLGKATGLNQFIDLVIEKVPLQQFRLNFPNRSEVRYSMGACSIYAVVQSLKEEGYFSHRSAAVIHGLLDPDDQIFFNFEQSKQSQSLGEMTQDSIDRAFKNKARITQNTAQINEYTIWLLNGKNTNCYGVAQLNKTDYENLRVTNIARTLIDMAVRPGYSGGPLQVLQAYRNGLEFTNGPKLLQMLDSLKHIYPYHQVVGYYMERAGFRSEQLEPFRRISMNFDFYLDYQIVEPLYSSTWRLFYPANLDSCS